MTRLPQLICPAGSLPALKTAVDNGADAVYTGFKNATNARNFAGLNFTDTQLAEGIRYAQSRGREVLIAINTFAQAGRLAEWRASIDRAADLGADAIILADMGLLAYAHKTHPQLKLHLSVQGSATNFEAINLAHECFGIRRAVLPRVLTLPQVEYVIKNTPVEIETFGFGSLCVMAEGRCILSSYATGQSPNTHGVCSPAAFVRWDNQGKIMNARLNGILIDRFDEGEPAGYPTLCKGRFAVQGETYYALEEPVSLNVLSILPELIRIGVTAIKVEGRQRSPAYVSEVTKTLRAALDTAGDEGYAVKPEWSTALDKVSEGHQQTLGAYSRPWK
ncbi:putative protease [Formivibrio citricus]|uniref:Ubiquinone biosynthesis protein UbiU n=1 Tax=Formivibrio citricus TaxID=83765 RepID=A0A1I5C360_9NEIS|nr:peptidase U32 family protein [Formivibrio citricus]SFN81367.1 putative protease [Formivibrio citricus]